MNASRAPTLLLIVLLGYLAGCNTDPGTGERRASAPTDTAAASSDSDLVGTWTVDAETQEWLPRACVVLDVSNPARATFDLTHEDDALYVHFRNPARTVWRSAVRNGAFEGLQILPTTETGRFCGRETPVRLELREVRPGILRGVWRTPECDVCPDRHFGATRVGD